MNVLLIFAAFTLLALVLILAFRVKTLVDVMKGATDQINMVANKVNAALIPIFFAIFLALFYWSYQQATPYFLPDPVSDHGVRTDFLFWMIMAVLVISFLVTNILLYWFPYKYQYSESRRAYFYPDNHKIELLWTVIPALVMAVFVYMGLKEWNDITRDVNESECEVIEIVGKQFSWQARYGGKDNVLGRYKFKYYDATNEFGMDLNDPASFDDFVPREMHLPLNKRVLLKIRARDVIHSVFLPHFRVKMDAVPGMATKFHFVPTKTTTQMREELGKPNFNYELACTEICGRGHFAMRMIVVVDDEADFAKWKAEQPTWVSTQEDYVKTTFPGIIKSTPVINETPVVEVVSDSLESNKTVETDSLSVDITVESDSIN